MSQAPQVASPSISIALATYNGAQHLREQLASLQSQTLPPFELVITDDGSTDETIEIINTFAAEAVFPVRAFQNERRLGYADNFLKAAALCKGFLIAFCDQDDVWDNEKLARCAAAFSDPEVVLCLHTAQVWDGSSALIGQLYPEIITNAVYTPPALDPFKLVPGFAMVLRADLLQLTNNSHRPPHLVGLTEGAAPEAHDAWTWFLATCTGKIVTVAEPLALYRQHASNTLGAPKETSAKSSVLLAISDFQYEGMADLEAVYASIAESLGTHLQSPRREYAHAASRKLAFRSRCHRLRAKIYTSESNLLSRSANFIRLVMLGAYRNDSSKALLGPKAGVKDLLFGVPALHRLLKN